LYDAFLPPYLKFYHITDISPSGWIKTDIRKAVGCNDKTHCDYEITVSKDSITPLKMEDLVPYLICSFDIEALGSHGDFPIAKKTHQKLVVEIIDVIARFPTDNLQTLITLCIVDAFFKQEETECKYSKYITCVYPKVKSITQSELRTMCNRMLTSEMTNLEKVKIEVDVNNIEKIFAKAENNKKEDDDQEDDENEDDIDDENEQYDDINDDEGNENRKD
jgi:hypothetical protein